MSLFYINLTGRSSCFFIASVSSSQPFICSSSTIIDLALDPLLVCFLIPTIISLLVHSACFICVSLSRSSSIYVLIFLYVSFLLLLPFISSSESSFAPLFLSNYFSIYWNFLRNWREIPFLPLTQKSGTLFLCLLET